MEIFGGSGGPYAAPFRHSNTHKQMKYQIFVSYYLQFLMFPV